MGAGAREVLPGIERRGFSQTGEDEDSMPIGQKIFEMDWKGTSMSVRSIGPEGLTMEMTAQGEVTGYGPAKGLKGFVVLTFQDLRQPNGISTGNGKGILTTPEGDMAVWNVTFAGRMKDAGSQGWIGPATFMTGSKKLAFLNEMVCITEGEGKTGSPEARDIVYEWAP
jgi:hypothetical protein